MKVISDTQVSSYLLSALTRDSLVHEYIPLLVTGLKTYEADPEGLPERTVRASATPGSDTTHLFMPCILANNIGVKVISGGPTNLRKNLGFQGSISVLNDFSGELEAVLNAKSITAFRTALASCVGMVRVFPPAASPQTDTKPGDEKQLVVFGAGPQSFWHVILAAKLYKISNVAVVSRNFQSAETLAQQLRECIELPVKALALDDPRVQQWVHASSIIFGCTPSTDGIIRDEYIKRDGRRKYVSLIGSYKPHMIELSLDFIKAQYAAGTKILVDSKAHCLAEAGELIQADIAGDQLVELSSLDSFDMAHAITESGVVLLKIVGLLVMDIVIAKHLSRVIQGAETDFD